MKRQQYLVAGAGVLILLVLYIFGQTVPPHKNSAPVVEGGGPSGASTPKPIDFQDLLQAAKSRLSPSQSGYVNKLENAVVRGDVHHQQLRVDRQLAAFWRDSIANGYPLFDYYTGETAKLENSEKSLTFAAQLFLRDSRGVDDASLRSWMATEAKELFEKALEINPKDDSAKVGLGASYIFGGASGNPQESMQGIQQILEVAGRDSNNMYAQFMLAVGGVQTGQLDKAVQRLNTVVRHEPGNVEAWLLLASVEEQMGNKKGAIQEYGTAKKLIADPNMIRDIDQHLQSLQ